MTVEHIPANATEDLMLEKVDKSGSIGMKDNCAKT